LLRTQVHELGGAATEPWQPDESAAEPNVARMYHYWLGGYHNVAVDRAAAEAVSAAHPDVRLMARVNRAFVRRVVAVRLARGVDQFLDIGSGLIGLNRAVVVHYETRR